MLHPPPQLLPEVRFHDPLREKREPMMIPVPTATTTGTVLKEVGVVLVTLRAAVPPLE